MRLAVVTRYRPSRTADGEGGWTATYSDGATLYGAIRVRQNRTTVVYRNGGDVDAADVIEVDCAYYRVLGKLGPVEGPMREAEVERTSRPITP